MVNAMTDGQVIVWDDSCKIGIELMDNDHRVLVDLINQLPAAFEGGETEWVVGSVVNALMDYTEYHFGREEKLQELCGFAGCAGHKKVHAKLAAQAKVYQHAYLEKPESVDAQELAQFLKHWLMNHILIEDKKYVQAVLQHPEAIEQVAAMGFADGCLDLDDDDIFANLSVEPA
jgi:hemerythrin-like metal-binding protein